MRAVFMTILALFLCGNAAATETIPLWPGIAPGSETWNWSEEQPDSSGEPLRYIHNVVAPTLTVFHPLKPNGTAVMVMPGGGFEGIAWIWEGEDVARWLNGHGITVIVLKYRVAHFPPGETLTQEARELRQITAIPFAKEDAKQAMRLIQQHATEWSLTKGHIGVMGFSADGLLSIFLGSNYDNDIRPDFVAGIYPATSRDLVAIPADAPPLFMAVAADDYMPQSLRAFDVWNKAQKPVELHIYAKGGHGFAVGKHNLPVDTWTDRFIDWLQWLKIPADAK
jgi:acetyl esterase/lipase